jgi:SAM-dependent methyltransferase
VIFVNNYAFIILSLAILGLGMGGVFSYYRFSSSQISQVVRTIAQFIFITGIFLLVFIISVVGFSITNPFIYFLLLFLPFFFAGVVYALIFKIFADVSFKLYASDLIGAAVGSGLALLIFNIFNAPNAVLFLSLIMFLSAAILFREYFKKKMAIGVYTLILLGMIILGCFGHKEFLGEVPIGKFAEKDFHYVYPNLTPFDYKIVDSRWSLYGRSDLVEYRQQDMVKQLFIDGAAGSPMYRFNGNPQNPDALLLNLLVTQTTTIPFMFFQGYERDNMLIIGPGGGKEVLIGLLSGIGQITGVEVNPDFVDIVKDQSFFNGGIYTGFPNVRILVKEGRHFIKSTNQKYDLIVMALPSTEQLQNIDHLAASENYLLTVEAIQDYLKILTPEGSLIFTVHNRWELIRLIVTTLYALDNIGISNQEALNHFIIIAEDYAPTIVIKKNAYRTDDIGVINNVIEQLPPELPAVTYLPYHWNQINNTIENQLLRNIRDNRISLRQYIEQDKYDISPVYDDSPYFYKISRGIQRDYLWLLIGVALFSIILITVPLTKIKKSVSENGMQALIFPLKIFILIGVGFMIIEVTLFQKLILYLGSPTISLSVLLSSLLVGMGIGSYFGKRIQPENPQKRLKIVSLAVVMIGIFTILFGPYLLNKLLIYSQVLRSIMCFVLLLPCGFFLGIPFPSALELLKLAKLDKYIPWMYGVNGSMSVLGSVLAVILSMACGYTLTFYIGLSFYLVVFLTTLYFYNTHQKARSGEINVDS